MKHEPNVVYLGGGDCAIFSWHGPWPVPAPLPIPDPGHPERYAPVIDLSEHRKRRTAMPRAA